MGYIATMFLSNCHFGKTTVPKMLESDGIVLLFQDKQNLNLINVNGL